MLKNKSKFVSSLRNSKLNFLTEVSILNNKSSRYFSRAAIAVFNAVSLYFFNQPVNY